MSEPRIPQAGRTGGGATIVVVGCGYVGLVSAACLAHLGHTVTGVEVDGPRLEALLAGGTPLAEPGLEALVTAGRARGNLTFSNDLASVVRKADAVFMCVNTPATPSGAADLRFVRAAGAAIADAVAGSVSRPLVVNKSTSPIGTAETLDAILRRVFAGRPGDAPAVVANPEFLREGHAVHDFFHPLRIVVGAERREDAARVAALYGDIKAPVILTDPRTAEMIKYVSNAFLATRVSFANEVARLCEALDIDADAVIAGAAMDPRVGSDYLQPGVGYGGSCLPKDVAALCHTGECVESPMRLLASVQQVNANQRKHAVNALRGVLGGLEERRIGVWGATFKGQTDDLRDSPALEIIALLRNEGARVAVYDPSLKAPLPPDVADETCYTPLDAARGAEALAILSDWHSFADVELKAVRAVMEGDALYDGRNILSREVAEAAGFTYRGVGRPTRRGRPQPGPDAGRPPERGLVEATS